VLILTWAVPYTLYILFFIAIKPKHFFLPIALPLFSCLAFIFPFSEHIAGKRLPIRLLSWAALALVAVQFVLNVSWDYSRYQEDFHREETSESLKFYADLEAEHLACIPPDEHPLIYRDVRAYVPPSDRWQVEMKWGLVDYDYIRQLNPDVVVLQQQRIRDYTLEGVVETAAGRWSLPL
jgi:hypothetical protein